jgi:energy-converting hydrogenase Eha subunit A
MPVLRTKDSSVWNAEGNVMLEQRKFNAIVATFAQNEQDAFPMHTLSTRLRYLRSREALAAILLPAVIVWRWSDRGGDIAWGLRIAALALLVYILVQGTLYWHLKLRSLEDQKPLPSYFHVVFRIFKLSNLIAIGAILLVLLLIGRNAVSEADIGWTAGLLAGAVLEHINYFHYQLMYDTRASFGHLLRNGRLRKAALGIDIVRSGA